MMSDETRGKLIARALRETWRPEPPPCPLTAAELAELAPVLAATGAGGLVWRAARRGPLAALPEGLQLGWSLAQQAAAAARHAEHLAGLVRTLRAGGFEPIVVKGWACVRLYPEPGLRPPGDFDLLVEPERYEEAVAFAARAAAGLDVDFGHAELRSPEAYRAAREGSRLVDLAGTPVRVLGPEDHLRTLCLHFMRHFAYRPLWLCDVAVAAEAPGLRWERVLAGTPREASWVRAALALAGSLLGARPAGAPGRTGRAAPAWLAEEVLRMWGRGGTVQYVSTLPDLPPMAEQLRAARPGEVVQALRGRWMGPLEYSIRNELPLGARRPVAPQAVEGLARAGDLVKRALRRV